MARPSTPPPSWATNAGTRDPSGALPSGRQGTGWVPGESIAARAFNAVLGQFADWIVYVATLLPADGIVGAVAFRVYDAIGGTLIGTVSHSAGDLTVIAEDGLLLQGSGAGTPGVYLDDAAGTVRLQSYAADAAVIIRAGWDLNVQDFRVGFGDNVGDGSGYPTYAWNLSPNMGAWVCYAANAGLCYWYMAATGGIAADIAVIYNASGAGTVVGARTPLRRPVDVSEDGATVRETVTSLEVVFEDTNTEQPTVSLIRQTIDGNATRVVMASCSPSASATRQTVTDSSITSADLDWSTYQYFLEWDSVATIANGGYCRAVELVRVFILTRAGA